MFHGPLRPTCCPSPQRLHQERQFVNTDLRSLSLALTLSTYSLLFVKYITSPNNPPITI